MYSKKVIDSAILYEKTKYELKGKQFWEFGQLHLLVALEGSN